MQTVLRAILLLRWRGCFWIYLSDCCLRCSAGYDANLHLFLLFCLSCWNVGPKCIPECIFDRYILLTYIGVATFIATFVFDMFISRQFSVTLLTLPTWRIGEGNNGSSQGRVCMLVLAWIMTSPSISPKMQLVTAKLLEEHYSRLKIVQWHNIKLV